MPHVVHLPIPNSWYALAFSAELPPGRVLTRRLAGQDVVLYRTRAGRPNAVGPYCPHLGAHLGYGGTVQGEELRCPFHGFRFALDGRCTATGYGTPPPPTACLPVRRVHEANGLIFVWYDSRDAPPAWTPPVLPTHGWTPVRHRTFTLLDHPQETVENGVDIGHFAIVHGYRDVAVLRPVAMDGATFTTAYAATRPLPGLGRLGATVRFEFTLAIYGLGYSLVRVHLPRYGIHARLFILAVPLDAAQIALHLALSVHRVRGARIHPLLALVPDGLLSDLAARFVHDGLVHDARQDFAIWEHKAYLQPPALAAGDGPIGPFRRWARQFYYETPAA